MSNDLGKHLSAPTWIELSCQGSVTLKITPFLLSPVPPGGNLTCLTIDIRGALPEISCSTSHAGRRYPVPVLEGTIVPFPCGTTPAVTVRPAPQLCFLGSGTGRGKGDIVTIAAVIETFTADADFEIAMSRTLNRWWAGNIVVD